MKPPADLCVSCKGTKRLCGQPYCPVLKRINTQIGFKKKLDNYVFGPSQEVFIGSFGYPNLSFGPLATVDTKPLDMPSIYGRSYDEIIALRSSMVRGKRFTSTTKRMETEIQEIALSTKPTDVEMHLSKKPSLGISFSSLVQPMGPSAPLQSFKQAENPKIPKRIDAVIQENLLATEAISELLYHGFDNYYLTNIFSTGALGKKQNQKIVPTRWSITAMDDIVAKQRMEKLREYPQLNNIQIFSHEDYDNHYEVLITPGNWEFENFEAWSPKSVWARGSKEAVVTEEYEPFDGRSKYAHSQVGGYYASRFSVVEHLFNLRKQARVVVFREVGEGYMVPLGVFQVREGVRTALKKPSIKFQTLTEAFDHLRTKLNISFSKYIKKSKILAQSRLSAFF